MTKQPHKATAQPHKASGRAFFFSRIRSSAKENSGCRHTSTVELAVDVNRILMLGPDGVLQYDGESVYPYEQQYAKGVFDRTAGELIESLQRYPDDLANTVGAKGEVLEKIVKQMVAEKRVRLEYAQELFEQYTK